MRITEYKTQPGATKFKLELHFFDKDSIVLDLPVEPSDDLVKEMIRNQYAKGATIHKIERSTKYYSEY